MTSWIVRVEGVNFASTLFDTTDLSAVRGSSLTLLAIAGAVSKALDGFGAEPVFAGASICAFKISSDLEETALRQSVRAKVAEAFNAEGANGPAFPHICTVVDIAPITSAGEEQALLVAEARNKANQLRIWSMPPVDYDGGAVDADTLDGIRPATRDDALRGRLSPSVQARRNFGRMSRNGFYRRLPEAERPATHGYRFAQDFSDIVTAPPRDAALSARAKIAVFYADGNAFGTRRTFVGSRKFSADLTELQDRLLSKIVGWLRKGACKNFPAFAVGGADKAILRFETLIWGGDETLFVLPAWLAVDFISFYLRETAEWDVGGPLTHAIGVVIAHHKAPIRQLSRLAHEAADLSNGPVPGVFVAARTKIDAICGVAADHTLFHQEMVAPGAVFPLRLLLEAKGDPAVAKGLAGDLVQVLDRLTSPDGEYIGKGQADGFGRVRLNPENVTVFRKTLQKTGVFDSANEKPLWKDRTKAPPRGHVDKWSFDLICPGPFAVLDSSRAARRTERNQENNNREPQLHAQRLAERLPLLLGTSLSGALRSRARWLGALQGIDDGERTLSDPAKARDLTPVQRLFGVTGYRGRLSVEALTVDSATPWNVSSVKIDRFSGGPIDNALFTTATFIGTRIRFTLSLSTRGDNGPNDPDLVLAKKLADDVATNGLMLGHGGNKGFGWFTPATEN
jgi:CRISPR/Cas system CSM-associated protein Csm3 (group 7 of RAMP superfamily)